MGYIEYTIQSGDSVKSIANELGVSEGAVRNSVVNGDPTIPFSVMGTGNVIRIEVSDTYKPPSSKETSEVGEDSAKIQTPTEESIQSEEVVSQETATTDSATSTQQTQATVSVIKQINNIISTQIEQAIQRAKAQQAQPAEQHLESVPALWSMQSRDDLLRYFWIKRGNTPESYNQADAQKLVIDATWRSAHELGTQLDNFNDLNPTQQQYLTMLQSINQPPLLENGQQALLMHYQSEYAQLFGEQGMDTYFQMFADTQDIAESGAFIDPAFWEFAQAYQYVSALEDGATVPFTPAFDPDFATRTLLESQGWESGFGEQGTEDELIAEELMYKLGESLARRETEGVTINSDVSTEYLPVLYAMLFEQYGADFTAYDTAQFVNNLSAVLQDDNIPGDARLSLRDIQLYSGLYLSGRDMDRDRQLAWSWDTYQQQESQNLLGELEASIGKIQGLDGEILGVSTSEVKRAFANLLKTSSDYIDYLDGLKNQAPNLEDDLVAMQEATEESKRILDQTIGFALLTPFGMLSETFDTVASGFEFLVTGDPFAALGLAPIIPNLTNDLIRAGRSAELLTNVLSYMDDVSDMARYGFDSADQIRESLKFYREFSNATDNFGMGTGVFDLDALVARLNDFMPAARPTRGDLPRGGRFSQVFYDEQSELLKHRQTDVSIQWGAEAEIALGGKQGAFRVNSRGMAEILIPSGSTRYVYYHELSHLDHYERIGHDAWIWLTRKGDAGTFLKELYVWNSLRANMPGNYNRYLNFEEMRHATEIMIGYRKDISASLGTSWHDAERVLDDFEETFGEGVLGINKEMLKEAYRVDNFYKSSYASPEFQELWPDDFIPPELEDHWRG